jgi:hypothetical protein
MIHAVLESPVLSLSSVAAQLQFERFFDFSASHCLSPQGI